MRGGHFGLSRLRREKYQRMREAGTFPQVDEPPQAATLEALPTLRRGGRAEHPQWFAVMALVRKASGALDPEFVTEQPTLSKAIADASRYAFRAVVVSRHSKREFDNWKPIEVEPDPSEQTLIGDGEGRR